MIGSTCVVTPDQENGLKEVCMFSYRKVSRPAILTALALALIAPTATPANAEPGRKFYGQIDMNYGQFSPGPTTVRVAGDPAFTIHAPAGGFTALERALIVERNVNNALLSSSDRTPTCVEIVYINNIPVIRMGGKHVVTIDSNSAKFAGTSMAALAEEWAGNVKAILTDNVKVTTYLAQLDGDYISPAIGIPFRRARLEAARKNHASDLFRADLPMDLVSSDSFEDKGMACMLKRDPVQAEVNFRKALALSPENARAHYGLGVSLLKQGKVDDSIGILQYARWLDHDDAEVHLALGQAYETKGLDLDAYKHYREASLLQPDNPEAVLYIADLREEKNDIGKSVRELNAAMTQMPDSQYVRLRRNDQLVWRLKRPM